MAGSKSAKLPDFDRMQAAPTIFEKQSMQQNLMSIQASESRLDSILKGFEALKQKMER